MNRTIPILIGAVILGVGLLPRSAEAADYSGSYEGSGLSIVMKADHAGYQGEIHKGSQSFPLQAHEENDHLAGSFSTGGNDFVFTATQTGDDLTLLTGGNTLHLHRNANPLAALPSGGAAPAQGGASPVAQSPQTGDFPANFVVLTKTATGVSLVRELPNVKTTGGAFRSIFPDLAQFFGGRPNILGAYEDQRNHTSAFVSFSAQRDGQPVKGFVTCKLREQGSVVFVVYGKQDATRAEWSELTATPKATGGGAGEPTLDDQMAAVPLTVYSFPDGTGAVGLAEGWTTQAQTESNLIITGPADQKIRMALGESLLSPDSMMAQQMQRNGQPMNMAIAPYSADPVTALGNITKANSILNQRRGGPALIPERVINSKEIPARNPGGRAAQVTYDLGMGSQQSIKHYRVFIQFETSPPRQGNWGIYIYLQLFAPVETFKQDYPVMMAQAFSLSENADAVMAKSRKEIEAANARAAAQRAAIEKTAQANYDRAKSVEENRKRQSEAQADFDRNEQIKLRSDTDFDEVIRGVRTVEDTQTGEQTSVNLADVHDIVDNLNNTDPGRYREIPLRDEVYPMPGHENDPDYISR